MSAPPPPTGLRLLASALAARGLEIVVWLGLPIAGLVTARAPLGLAAPLWLAAISVPLVLHTLLLNDWAGLSTSVGERQRLGLPTHARLDASVLGWAGAVMGALGVGLAAVRGIGLAAGHGPWLVGLAGTWVVLSVLYSAPRVSLKLRPAGAILAHLAGGASLFLLGAVLAGDEPRGAAPLAAFFGLVLVAGSLNHQADHAGEDRAGGCRTLAVRFGADKAARTGFVIFLLAHALLVGLWLRGWVSTAMTATFSLPALVQIACAPIVWRPDARPSTWQTYRLAYRAAFAVALLAATFLKVFAGADIVG